MRWVLLAITLMLAGCAGTTTPLETVADVPGAAPEPASERSIPIDIVVRRDISLKACDGPGLSSFGIPIFSIGRLANDTHVAVELTWDDGQGIHALSVAVHDSGQFRVSGPSPLHFELNATQLASLPAKVQLSVEGAASHCSDQPAAASAIVDLPVDVMVRWNA